MNKLKKRLSSFSFRGFSVPSSSDHQFTELEQEISDEADDEALQDSVFVEVSGSKKPKTCHSSSSLWIKGTGSSGDNSCGATASTITANTTTTNALCKKKCRSVVLSTQSYFSEKAVSTFKLGRSNTVSVKSDESPYHYGEMDTYTRLNLLGTGANFMYLLFCLIPFV